MPEAKTDTPKATGKNVAPDGLTKEQIEAWEASLPEPDEELVDKRETGQRVKDLEARLDRLEEMLNLSLTPPTEDEPAATVSSRR